MRKVSLILWFVGILTVVALVLYVDAGKVLRAITGAGPGIAAIIVLQLAPITADSLSWRFLVPPQHRPTIANAMRIRWYGESVKALVPIAPIAAELVRVRAATLYGVPVAVAVGTIVVDFTLGITGQVIFTLAGLATLAWRVTSETASIALIAAAGSVTLFLLLVAFLSAQRIGLFGLITRTFLHRIRLAALDSINGSAERLDAAVTSAYLRRPDLVKAFALRTTSWFLGTLEVWIALQLLGHPRSLAEAMMLESIGYGVRAAAFVIPGALGAQEAAFIVLGNVVGLGAEIGLALSLIKRGRELTVGLPGLLAWQVAEGSRFWRRTNRR